MPVAYILLAWTNYEGSDILGVFAKLETAEKVKAEWEAAQKSYDGYRIETWDLQ